MQSRRPSTPLASDVVDAGASKKRGVAPGLATAPWMSLKIRTGSARLAAITTMQSGAPMRNFSPRLRLHPEAVSVLRALKQAAATAASAAARTAVVAEMAAVAEAHEQACEGAAAYAAQEMRAATVAASLADSEAARAASRGTTGLAADARMRAQAAAAVKDQASSNAYAKVAAFEAARLVAQQKCDVAEVAANESARKLAAAGEAEARVETVKATLGHAWQRGSGITDRALRWGLGSLHPRVLPIPHMPQSCDAASHMPIACIASVVCVCGWAGGMGTNT